MTKPLTLVKIMDRVLYRTDGVTQVSIVSPTISGVDSGWFSGDELLSLKVFNVLGNGVSAHVNRFAYGFVARIALEGFPIFTVHQIGVDSDLTEGQSERKDFIRQRKIIFDGVALVVVMIIQAVPPEVFFSIHCKNFSLGTINRLPILIFDIEQGLIVAVPNANYSK